MHVVPFNTVRVGPAPPRVSVPPAPGPRNQLFFVASWSEKLRLLIVRGASSVTTASAGRLNRLKFAVEVGPSAMPPPVQFAVLVQLPPEGFVQDPLAACDPGTNKSKAAVTQANKPANRVLPEGAVGEVERMLTVKKSRTG